MSDNREGTIRAILRSTYGTGSMVDAAVPDVLAAIDRYPGSREEAYGRGLHHVVMLKLWDWFTGGTTADSTATKILDALGLSE